MSSDYDDLAALLRRFCIPFAESKRDSSEIIAFHVPDEAAGRQTKEHPGAMFVLQFINGKFAGAVTKTPLLIKKEAESNRKEQP